MNSSHDYAAIIFYGAICLKKPKGHPDSYQDIPSSDYNFPSPSASGWRWRGRRRTGINRVTPVAKPVLLTEKLAGEAVAELADIVNNCSYGRYVLPGTDSERVVASFGGGFRISVQLLRLVIRGRCG